MVLSGRWEFTSAFLMGSAPLFFVAELGVKMGQGTAWNHNETVLVNKLVIGNDTAHVMMMYMHKIDRDSDENRTPALIATRHTHFRR